MRYSLATLAVGMLVSMMVAVVISVQASEKAVRDSEVRQCESVAADIRAYELTPPQTDVGRQQLKTKRDLYRAWGCPVPGEKGK